jgi:hypothetical protein
MRLKYRNMEKFRAYRNRQRQRNYASTQKEKIPAKLHLWTSTEDELVLAHIMPDRELSSKINRSVNAIQKRRCIIKDRVS